MDTELKGLMVVTEISLLHISFPSVLVNNNRNLTPFLIRCVVDPRGAISETRWDELSWAVEVSEGTQWAATSVVSTGDVRDRSATPKDVEMWWFNKDPGSAKWLGKSSPGISFRPIWEIWEMPWRFVCGICILRCGLAGLQGRFLQKKMQQPEAAFWEAKMCLDLSVCEAGQRPWAPCWLWVKSGWWEKKWGKDEAELPELPLNTWNVVQHLLRILRSKTYFDQ